MGAQGRHPLVLGLLRAFGAMASAAIGQHVLATDVQIESVIRHQGRYHPGAQRRTGIAGVKRAATKRRNVIRNRRAHRG